MNETLNNVKRTFNQGSMFTKIIMINVAVFIITTILSIFIHGVNNALAMPGSFGNLLLRPWSPITYMFVHDGFLHLLFNMLWLYWFGQIFLTYLSDKHLLAIYLMGGLIGALMHLLANTLLPVYIQFATVGSSAAVMAIVFAISLYKKDHTINLLFIGEIKLKYLAYIALFFDVIGALQNLNSTSTGGDGIAHIAHLGGALYGILFAYKIQKGKDITRPINNILTNIFSWFARLFSRDNKSYIRVKYNNSQNTDWKYDRRKKDREYNSSKKDYDYNTRKTDWEYNQEKAETNEELDRILDKISAGGYESLTEEEKIFLFKSKKY